MMGQFIEVLGLPMLACLAMVSILGYVGIHVLAREIIFIDIALAQIAAVGAIAAHLLFMGHDSVVPSYACALGASLLAAAFYAVARSRVRQIPLEATIGISYGVAAAAALFLVGIAPGGHLHVQHMLAGSILWTSWTDLLSCAVVFSVVGIGFHAFRKPFTRISADYDRAVQEGMRAIRWDFLFYVFVGIVVTLSVRIGGVVIVFAFLIIPATLSALFSSNMWTRMLAAWGTGAAASLLGLVFADRLDFSVGPSVVLFLGLALVLASLFSRGWRLVSGVLAATVILGFTGLALLQPSSIAAGRGAAPRSGGSGGAPCVLKDRVAPLGPAAHEHEGEATDRPDPSREEERLNRIEIARDIGTLRALLENTTTPDVRSRIVCRAMDLDPHRGILLALEFLEEDPPFYFRQTVVDRLVQIEKKATALDVLQPFSAEGNRKAAARLRRKYGGRKR